MSTDHVSTHPDSPLHGNGIGSEAINLAAIRQEYTKGGLKEGDLPDNPLSLFNRWLHEAIDAQVDEPTAMLVGTVSPEGQPSTRTVLLKDLHDGKFIFRWGVTAYPPQCAGRSTSLPTHRAASATKLRISCIRLFNGRL